MGKVFNLPNGGCLYFHDEIRKASLAIAHARKSYNDACSDATKYAEEEWKNISLLKRTWYQIKSGIFDPEEWLDLYKIKYRECLQEYLGTGCISLVGGNCYHNDYFAADEIIDLGLSKRNVYLNPRQISVIEHLRNNSPIWESNHENPKK